MKDATAGKGQIYVKSHVPRDLLQTAAILGNERKVVWEYVSNSLQYIDEGTSPEVRVMLNSRKKRIVVEDNGRGMDWDGLQHYFTMHGENIERKLGKGGRGQFGTGTSAAFGIAERLRVTTVRNGKRSKVQLSRRDIESVDSGGNIPVETIECEISTMEPNGTIVEIEGIYLKRSLNRAAVIKYVESHLARWADRNVEVYVNNQKCEHKEPAIYYTRKFRPEDELRDKLGNVELEIKVGTSIVDEEIRGIGIYSKGVLHEITLAGNAGREMSKFIFGDIDVPKLAEDDSPISPFHVTRDMTLNIDNELVKAIHTFVGQKVELVCRELQKEDRERRATEEAKKLAQQANEIAEIINEDFVDFRQRLVRARAKAQASTGFDAGPEMQGDSEQDILALGSEVPADIVAPTGEPGSEGGERTGGEEPRTLGPEVAPGSPEAKKRGRPAGGKGGRSATRGGFGVDFRQLGPDEHRAKFERAERMIYINTDHPQLVAAKGSHSVEDPVFMRLAYEVAFSEYAIALARELGQFEFMEISDVLFDVRDTLNRITRKAAHLYSA